MSDKLKKHQGLDIHRGPDHSAPYPVSRMAPAIELVDLAQQIQEADETINVRANSKLKVIADQIKALQDEARNVLEDTQRDQALHRAKCNFVRQPGKVYHLYRREEGELYFSMLSPEDWNGEPPHEFVDSYRLEADMSWTPADRFDQQDDTAELVQHLLEKTTPS